MPTINPDLVPLVTPGSLFNRLVNDPTLNVRFYTPEDPVHFATLNRPIADGTLRELVIAKTVDQISLRLSHQSLFPFLVPPKIDFTTSLIDLPLSWIWDLHVSMPKKWRTVRLVKIKRLDGENPTGGTGDFTGTVRFIFSGVLENSSSEVALFYADYEIDSVLSFQVHRVTIVTSAEEPNAIDSSEAETIDGFIIFRTLDTNEEEIADFFNLIAPVADYEIADTTAGGASVVDDFSLSGVIHGTGTLVSSATNAIPSLDSDPKTWLNAFNYPYRIGATRISTDPIVITIPSAIFQEFNIIAPAADEPSDDITGAFSPVWISRIERQDIPGDCLKIFFATFNITSASSTTPIEFASLTLKRSFIGGQIVKIEDEQNLLLQSGSDETQFRQGFGKGHVRLSSLWNGSTTEIDDFFDEFAPLVGDMPSVSFTKSTTVISSYAISRVPRGVPTFGQSEALTGSTSRLETPIQPSDDNRYVMEQDVGLGDSINFPEDKPSIPAHSAIEPIGHTGSRANKILFLTVDSSDNTLDYDIHIKPRLECLNGGPIKPGAEWWNGTRKLFFNDKLVWVG